MLVWGNTTTQNRLSQSLTTSELTNRLHPFTTQHVVVGLIHHHRLATLHPHSRTSLQHTDESSHRSVGYRRLNYNALSHSCFINHSDWPATKHKPWTQSWLANTIFLSRRLSGLSITQAELVKTCFSWTVLHENFTCHLSANTAVSTDHCWSHSDRKQEVI